MGKVVRTVRLDTGSVGCTHQSCCPHSSRRGGCTGHCNTWSQLDIRKYCCKQPLQPCARSTFSAPRWTRGTRCSTRCGTAYRLSMGFRPLRQRTPSCKCKYYHPCGRSRSTRKGSRRLFRHWLPAHLVHSLVPPPASFCEHSAVTPAMRSPQQ